MVSFLIISYNRPNYVIQAVRSIRKMYPSKKEILVLDNGSQPALRKILDIKFFRSKKNLGVAAGRNFLAKKARGDFLFFLDDDAVLRQDLKPIIRWLITQPKIAVVGLNIFIPPNQLYWRTYRCSYSYSRRRFKTFTFIGAAFLVRKKHFLALDGFDEQFFYAGEEMDFCYRAQQMGFEIWHFPGEGVLHRIAPSPMRNRFKHYFWNTRAHILFASKNLDWWKVPFHIFFWIFYNFKLILPR